MIHKSSTDNIGKFQNADTVQDDKNFMNEYKADKRKSLIYLFILLSLLIFVFLISFSSGRYNMSISDVLASVYSGIKHGIWWVISHLGISLKEPDFMTGPQDTVIWRVHAANFCSDFGRKFSFGFRCNIPGTVSKPYGLT